MWHMLLVSIGMTFGMTEAMPAQTVLAHAFTGVDEPSLLDRPAYLSVAEMGIEEALHQLSHSSGVPLAFSLSMIPQSARVSCSCDDRTVKQALDHMLAGMGLSYAEVRQQIVIEPIKVLPPPRPGMVLASHRDLEQELHASRRNGFPAVGGRTLIGSITICWRTSA
jgi:hypothetical protein